MSRTIKTDQPPLKMTVEAGRLLPASEYDAERLDTYRRGSTLNVFITHEKQRVDEKKWWAAINRAVKECRTPWPKSAQASEAIKLALGIVNYSKTIGGDYMQYPKSLTELDDGELAEAIRGLFDVLYGVTGVDPEEWKKQVAHIRDEEPSSSPKDDAGSDGVSPHTGAVAAEDPADKAEAGADQGEAADGQSAAPAPELSDEQRTRLFILEECADVLLREATDADKLATAAAAWRSHLPDDVDFVDLCEKTADRVIADPIKKDEAAGFLKKQALKRAAGSVAAMARGK